MTTTSTLGSLATGLALGLSLAAPPGPVNALITREASRHGVAKGVRAGLPAPLLDTFWLAVVGLGLPRLVDVRPALPWLAAAGAALLAWMALVTVRHREAAPPPASAWSLWAVTATNPFQYAWWATVGIAFVATQGLAGVAGFLLAIFGWVLAYSLLVARGAARWPGLVVGLEVLSADALLVFALQMAWTAATAWTGSAGL